MRAFTREKNSVHIDFYVSKSVHQRIVGACQIKGVQLSNFCREAVLALALATEKEYQEQAERHSRAIQTMAALPKIKPAMWMNKHPIPKPETVDLPSVFYDQACRVVEVLGEPLEKRVRLQEAIAFIRKKFPLTHGTDEEIVSLIEVEVRKILEVQEADRERESKKNP